MVKMKVRQNNVRYGVEIETGFLIREILKGVYPAESIRPFVAGADIGHEDSLAGIDEQRPGGEPDAVFRIRGNPARPNVFWDRPEHRPPVQPEKAVVINGNLKSPEGHHLNSFSALSRGSLAHLQRPVEAMDEDPRFSSIPCGRIGRGARQAPISPQPKCKRTEEK